jgi:transcriptional regulator with XRE-family HTH domain
MEYSVGERLRYVRARAKISQRELAKKVGIANSTISLIEADQTNPSVGALKRILEGIPLTMTEFFAFDPGPQQCFYKSNELFEIGKGPISWMRVGDNIMGRALQILKERYEPGADTGRIMITHEGQEGGIVISGCMEVIVGEERRILRPGDAYYFDSRLPHRFRCIGDMPCEIFSASTPSTF